MAKIYYRQVKAGKRAIDEVPEYWRDKVRAMLEADGEEGAADGR